MAITAASSGDTLVITGTCGGNLLVDKDLTLRGRVGATFDGGDLGTTLVISEATVMVIRLTVTGGWGGISNQGGHLTIERSTVRGNNGTGVFNGDGGTLVATSTAVTENSDFFVGGISNDFGSVTLNGTTSVRGNISGGAGGISTNGGSVVMNDSASVTDNEPVDPFTGTAGGIEVLGGTLIMNDASSVQGNMGFLGGGHLQPPWRSDAEQLRFGERELGRRKPRGRVYTRHPDC